MKNKNVGRGVLITQPDQQKRPQCKNAQKKSPKKSQKKKKKELTNIEKFFLARFAHSASYKIHIANRHAPVRYAEYVFFFIIIISIFLSSHHDTNPLLYLYHFRTKI